MRRIALATMALFCSTCVKTITVRQPSYAHPAATCESTPADVDVVTFNAGLGPGIVQYSSGRAPHVVDAVASTPFDVMCLQEIWTDADRDAIVARLGLPRENVAFARTAGIGETGEDRCTEGELDRLEACTAQKCGAYQGEDVTICALSQCHSALTSLFMHDRECVNCLAAMAGRSTDDVRRTCTTSGASRIYGGRNGVILVSRWPLHDPEAILLPASNANRVALFARVDVPGKGSVELACTHISSTQEIPPYHSGYDEWDEEKEAQLIMISDRLRARAQGRPQIFVGDMNFGGARGDTVEDESGWVWYDAHERGFSDPVGYVDPPICSMCAGNSFVGHPRRSQVIDHALLRDPPGGADLYPTCAEHLFDRPVEIRGHDGHPVTTNLSDHYGIRVKFRFR